jgi:hypothetical protein
MRATLSSLGRSFHALRLAVAALWICITGSSSFGAVLLVPAQFPNIQSAIDASASGDEIVVASGIYAGGFDLRGKRLNVRSQSGALTTIVDLSATGGTGCRAESQEPVGTTLQGFTIRGATTSAIKVGAGAALSVRACRIMDSTCTNLSGAGIRCDGGDLEVHDCVFTNLHAECTSSNLVARGGAISLSADAFANITHCNFTNCRVSNTVIYGAAVAIDLSAEGGAIACEASALLLSNCIMDGCSAIASRPMPTTAPWAYSGFGTTIARGGAVSVSNGSSAAVSGSHFGNTAPCQAIATLERRNHGGAGTICDGELGLFAVRAHGGALCAWGSTLLNIDTTTFSSNDALARVGTVATTNEAKLPQVEATAEGGSLHFSATSGGTLVVDGLSVIAGRSIIETYPLDPLAGPYINNCISASTLGHSMCLRPGTSGVPVSDSEFRDCGGVPIDVVGGTGVSFQRCVFRENLGASLRLQGNSALVTECNFRLNAATPIINSTAGTAPTVVGTLFCENTPNQINGSWIDGGGNTFSSVCLTNDCNNNGVEDAAEIASGNASDCNANGRPDSCDITDATSEDCDENEIPDECQFQLISRTSPALSPVQSGTTLVHTFSNLPEAGSDVRVIVDASADLSSVNETILLKSGKTVIGTLFQVGGADCTPVNGELSLAKTTFNQLLSPSGAFTLQLVPSFAVTAGTCTNSWAEVQILYQPSVAGDCNANATPDICDVLYGESKDANRNGIPDECEELPDCIGDLNLDGVVNAADLSYLLAAWGGPDADLNADRVTGAADLSILLDVFGDCVTQP